VAAIKILLGGWSPDIMTEMGAQVVLLRYSRSAETEADEVALKLLRDSKIAATGFATFFERLASKERKGSSPSVPDIFSTHPSTPERAKRAASQPSYPATPALTDAEWTALRNICGT